MGYPNLYECEIDILNSYLFFLYRRGQQRIDDGWYDDQSYYEVDILILMIQELRIRRNTGLVTTSSWCRLSITTRTATRSPTLTTAGSRSPSCSPSSSWSHTSSAAPSSSRCGRAGASWTAHTSASSPSPPSASGTSRPTRGTLPMENR